MKKFISIIAGLLLLPIILLGGGLKIQLQGGLGTYSMTDMASLDQYITNQFPLPLHLTTNYPPYFYYKGAFLFRVGDHFSFGPMYAYHSTGSRYSLADYSGQYFFDDLITANSLGLTFNYQIPTDFNLNYGLYLEGGMSLSKIEFMEHLEFTEVEYSYTESRFANETSFFVEPGISFGYPVRFIEPGLRIGYLIPVARNGLKDSESGQNLYVSDSEKVKTGWNGFRIGLAVTLSF